MLEVVNVGLGPAIYVSIKWARPRTSPGENPLHPCEHEAFPEQATLAAGQRITLTFTTQWVEPSSSFPDELADMSDVEARAEILGVLSVRYVDVHERPGEISRTILLSQRRFTTQIQFANDEDTRFQAPGMPPWRYRPHFDE
jgi:hypothetical protein